jgi:hypothetical protein
MGNIGVYFTDKKKILVVSRASALPKLLSDDQKITHSWFYNPPAELEKFFKIHPDERDLFDQAFAYWIICKVFRLEQREMAYGMLKRKLSEFHGKLLKVVRNLVSTAVNDIKSFWSYEKKKSVKYCNGH